MKIKKHLIINPNIKGKFYIEDFNTREEEDRIKFYDSDGKYFDYLPLDIDGDGDADVYERNYNNFINTIATRTSIKNLLDYFVCDYELIGTKDEVSKYFRNELNFDDDYDFTDNEYVVRIGNVYIVLSEN